MRTFLLVLLFTGTLSAQSPITFSGRNAQSGAAVTPDSVYVRSESGGKDTTLIGSMSLHMDWLTSTATVAALPARLQLGGPFPNGFESSAQFDLSVERQAPVRIDVVDLLGKSVVSFEKRFEAGTQRFRLDAPGLAAGVYVLRVSDGRTSVARKLLKTGLSSSPASTARLVWMGTLVPAGAAPHYISEVGKAARPQAGSFTFIGYAAGFLPDTLEHVTPVAGENLEFTFLPNPDSRKIRIGRLVDEGRTTIPSAGGTVTVSRAGSPVEGLSIRVPANSYPGSREFSIGYAPVEGHDLGQYFHPISPMITIGNGGGYSEQVMELTIPVEIPAGQFAMAWLYNERTGEVEALPPIAQDAHTITVMTRHFSTSSVSGLGKKSSASDPFANVLVTSILESALAGQTVINTGFQPGRDDWEFVNHGSVLAPSGHCAGQSITAMWYYYEQRLQATPPRPALYGAYDRVNKTPEELWMDNREGNRFASVIQEELDFEGRLAKLLWKGRDSSYHSLSWKAFAAAMLVTGCPQYVGLTRLKADGTPDGGHAIIAYRQSFAEGKLYVADPNYPGTLRAIEYDAQKGYYKPYGTKQDADEADVRAYQNIGFTAKTALIEWDRVTARWPEFLDKSIGSNGAPLFPQYGIDRVIDASTREEIDPAEEITVVGDSVWFAPQAGFSLSVFTLEGNRAEVNSPANWWIPLTPGENTLGLYTMKGGEFVDFIWVRVNRVAPRITKITPSSGKPGDVILIEGTDFGADRGKSAALFGGIAMTDIVEWTDTAIRAKIPATAVRGGYVTVRRDKAESNRKWLDIMLTIANVAPLHGHWGDKVTILGTGLTKLLYVRFNGHLVPECYTTPDWTDSLMVVTVPNNCVSGVITFTPLGGEDITGPAFTQDSVMIADASPLSGPGHTVITITGEHFGQGFWPGSQVTIGGVVADPVLNWTDTEIKIYGRNTGRIAVTVCGKTAEGPMYINTP